MPLPEQGSAIDPRRDWRWGVFWLGLAFLMRFAFLSQWSLWGDEYYTLTDARRALTDTERASGRAYPLFFVLVKAALFGLPARLTLEFKLRCVAALAGALAVWVVYRGTRSILPPLERHLFTVLIAFSPWLLFLSQWARFYSLLFLFSAAGVFLLLRALETNSMAKAWMAIACITLAILTHPSAVLLLGSLILAGIVSSRLGHLPARRALFPLYALLMIAVSLVLLSLFHWELVENTIVQRLQSRKAGAESIPDLVQGIVYSLGIAPSILSGLGVVVLFRRDPRLFWFVIVGAGLPVLTVLGLAAQGAEMDQRYLIPEVALLLIPAAVMLGELLEGVRGSGAFARILLALLVFLPMAPSVYSHYVDGNSHDLRSAAEFVERHWRDGDAIVCENNAVMELYAPRIGPQDLIEAPPETPLEYEKYRKALKNERRLWVVIPDDFQFRGGAEASFHDWAFTHLPLATQMYPARIDYHQNRLLVFLGSTRDLRRWNR